MSEWVKYSIMTLWRTEMLKGDRIEPTRVEKIVQVNIKFMVVTLTWLIEY